MHPDPRVIACALASGCSFSTQLSEERIVDAHVADVFSVDAYRVACVPWAWTPSNFDPCTAAPMLDGGTLVIDQSATYDTDSGVLVVGGTASLPSSATIAGAPVLRVVSVAGLDVRSGATLRVRGAAALVLAVHGTATIAGTVDVSAFVQGNGASSPGPGAPSATVCGASVGGMGGPVATELTAGGGGGGGFGRLGGQGGTGTGDSAPAGGTRGQPSTDTDLIPLRGGCAGGPGGGPGAGVGGAGGGALQIAVRDKLTVSGTLRSSGAGGVRGGTASGGGGGGSGGALFVEAGMLAIANSAALCANGGSGGEGGELAVMSADGTLGSCSASQGATTTGTAPNGGDGGTGGFRSSNSGEGSSASGGGSGGGGGGGGGSAGRIRMRSDSSPSITGSPTITPQET